MTHRSRGRERQVKAMDNDKKHSELPWRHVLSDSIAADDEDAIWIECDDHSIAELICPADVEQGNAALIVEAVNNYARLQHDRARLVTALNLALPILNKDVEHLTILRDDFFKVAPVEGLAECERQLAEAVTARDAVKEALNGN